MTTWCLQALMAIVPSLPSVPVQPLLLASQREYGMFEHFKRYPWVLEPYLYEDQDRLLAAITNKVIRPAEAKAKEQKGGSRFIPNQSVRLDFFTYTARS